MQAARKHFNYAVGNTIKRNKLLFIVCLLVMIFLLPVLISLVLLFFLLVVFFIRRFQKIKVLYSPLGNLKQSLVPEKEFFGSCSAVSRLLPLLKGHVDLISDDSETYTYRSVYAKPDLLAKHNNHLYMVEYKSRRYGQSPVQFLCKHALQSMSCAYVYSMSKNIDPKDITSAIRYYDCYIEIPNWWVFKDSIEFARNIYLKAMKVKSVSSSELAVFISLISPLIPCAPENEVESSMRGKGLHALAMVDGKFPLLFQHPEGANANTWKS